MTSPKARAMLREALVEPDMGEQPV